MEEVQATDAQEERAAQGAMAQGTASRLLRTGATNQSTHPILSAIAQRIRPQARHD